MEYLDIEIYNHFINPHSYILWNNKHLLGEVVEDDIMNMLDKIQLIDIHGYEVGPIKINRQIPEKRVKSIEVLVKLETKK